jgi:hypothetical protein
MFELDCRRGGQEQGDQQCVLKYCTGYHGKIAGSRSTGMAFRGWDDDSDLPSLASTFDAGIHHFVVCIYADEIDEIVFKIFDDPNGVGLVNVFPHKYMVDAEGMFEDVDDGLTEKERKDYERLWRLMELTPSDTARLTELRTKMGAVLLPPQASIAVLRLALSGPLVTGSVADHFFADNRWLS